MPGVLGPRRNAYWHRFRVSGGGWVLPAHDAAGNVPRAPQRRPAKETGKTWVASPGFQVDKHLGAAIEREMKPVVLVVAKWDLARGRAGAEEFADYLDKVMPGLAYAPVALVSAKDGKNVLGTIDLARNLFKQASVRVTTGQLNRVIEHAVRLRQPPSRTATLPKVYYATQVAVCPPTIVLFVNNPDLFTEDYRRFVEHRLREELPFPEVPLRLILRAHSEGEGERRAKGAGRRSRRKA